MKKNHPLKFDILESSNLFCDYSASDSDLKESVRKLHYIALNRRLNEEELFTIKSTVDGIEVFLEDYDFKRFDEICAKAKNKGYLESYVDLLLLKGFILSSFSMSGLNRTFRIEEKEKIFTLLKEIGVKENIYLDLIKGKYFLLKGDEKQTALIYEKIKNKIDPADCAAKVIILAILSSLYEREPSKQLKLIQEGLNGNCFYWNFVIQYIDFLTQRGRYVELLHEGSQFLQKLDENLEISKISKKLSILDHMIKASFKINEQEKSHNYVQLFRKTLDTLPEDKHGLKKNYEFLRFTHEVLYQALFEKELLIDLSEKNILNYSSNLFFNMLRSFLIVNPLISRLIQDNEFDLAFTYINNIEKGKGYSISTDDLLTFIKNFYISLLIDKSLKWKKYNLENFEGNQTEVALHYLEEAVAVLGEIDYSFKIAAILQEIILKFRLGRLEDFEETLLDEIQRTDGYDRVLALMVSLLYYSGKEEIEKYQKTRELLLWELDKYKDLSSYTTWKKHLNDIFSFSDIKSKILTTKKASFLDLEQIKSYTNFLQNQINKQMVR